MKSMQMLEFDKIKERIKEFALSDQAKAMIDNLTPAGEQKTVERWLQETTEARDILHRRSGVPLHALTDMGKILDKPEKGYVLTAQELAALHGFLRDGNKLKKVMQELRHTAPMVSAYALSIHELTGVMERIEQSIVHEQVDDQASAELAKIRRRIAATEGRLKGRLESILKSPETRKYLQEALVTVRNGRHVIPVRSEWRHCVRGMVLDSSASGSTVFVEPEGIRPIQEEIALLRAQEEQEVFRILAELSALVAACQQELSVNMEVMAQYDFAFAKARYSRSIDGVGVQVNREGIIRLTGARHPLIGRAAVPLDFSIGEDYRALVITGPNTGGKTVALKTVGLLTVMAQSGLHVPADPGSSVALFRNILVDIGDGQSIEQSLSTFSSHICNIIDIVADTSPDSLVILDELGAGTDPSEGMGLAIALLEEIYRKGATIVATTHYSEIKEFSASQPGFKNGCMAFDIDTLQPLYRLTIGRPGESNALRIALRLGLDRRIVERAHEVTYKEKQAYPEQWGRDGKGSEGSDGGREGENIFSARNERFEKDEKRELQHLDGVDDAVIQERVPAENTAQEPIQKPTPNAAPKEPSKSVNGKAKTTFQLGDAVYISTLDGMGIVCELVNHRGEVGVMYKKKKIMINHKRLSLRIEAAHLYPENYDMDIVFESKEDRKKRHLMSRKYVEGVTIVKPVE
ncbi:hypothetical protein GTO89_13320 [Heliobacterium gestii]|uniref:DNA mismatch repair proteins mutS family domain-containing protein n=1 Tax=Heliomicrobium gestii TaxID=2699 RepID=A0A845LKU3_HELGE|nr:hypothetical protein [Heliomicrobium gestii]MBM7867619.1 MutS2 family protein [Heliomicrobium gestii]MZP44013.1 hypothetical protein [Heliomicrobium gestii]